ncbi:MAG: GLUG motif-containing protein [Rikenellaceae bacterium]
MRKLLKTFALVAVAAVGAVSCTENMVDDTITPSTTEGVTLYATIPTEATSTRVEFTDNDSEGIALSWEMGDTFKLYGEESFDYFTFTCIDAETGSFYADITSDLTNGMTYTAKYNEDAEPSNQDGDQINNLDAACRMEATFTYGTDDAIAFEHTMAIMTFKFESTVRPAYLIFENGSTEYKVTYTELEPVNGIYTSHIMINPCDDTKRTLKFSLYNSEDTAYDIRTVDTDKAYVAGYRYTSPVSDLDPTIWLGSGTESDPYQISTAQQLRDLSTNVKEGTSYEGEYFVMTNDIDLGGIDSEGNGIEENEFTAIGYFTSSDDYCYFQGTFDGGGYCVSGLYIYQPEATSQALFGRSTNATIKNLSVSGSVTGYSTVAGVSAYNKNSTITSCVNSATVTSVRYYVGGVAGYNYGTVVSNCCNSGTISGECQVGGVAGYNSNSSLVTNCYNTGAIVGETTSESVSICGFGGVVGYNPGSTVSECYNEGPVSVSNANRGSYATYVGGVVGYNGESTLINSYNIGSVTGNQCYVGGVVGCNKNIVINCYNLGALELIGTGAYAGGVVGTSEYLASMMTRACYSSATITGADGCTGGVVGKISNANISDCYYDSTLYSGSSYGYMGTSSYIVFGDLRGFSTATMESSLLIYHLNNGAYDYNVTSPSIEAYAWKTDEGYPTFDREGTPTYTQFDIAYDSDNNLYKIYTANGMKLFANLVNSSSYSMSISGDKMISGEDSEFDFSDTNQTANGKLMSDIDLEGSEDNQWIPIGVGSSNSGYIYKGSFDGGGHEISGLYINQSSMYRGLFGYVSGMDYKSDETTSVTISNLGVSGSVTGQSYIGGIVGCARYTNIINCYNKATIIGSGSTGYIGGIAGSVTGETSYTDYELTNCYNMGTVTGTNSSATCVGGVVGRYATGTMSNCYNTAVITGESYRVGGVTGFGDDLSTISNCYNTGNVVSTGGETSRIGGIAGSMLNSTVSNCTYDSSVYTGSFGYDASGYGNTITNVSGSTTLTTDMKSGSFAATLGSDNWKEDTTPINNSYPILIWQ